MAQSVKKSQSTASSFKNKNTGKYVSAVQFSLAGRKPTQINAYDVIFDWLEMMEVPKTEVAKLISTVLYTLRDGDWLVLYNDGYQPGEDPRHYFQVIGDYPFKSTWDDIQEVAPF